MGDPGGVGPEVLVKALADEGLRSSADFVVFGLGSVMQRVAKAAGVEPFWSTVVRGEPPETSDGVVLIDHEPGIGERSWPAIDNGASGAASLAFLDDAISAARLPSGQPFACDGIVTAPISKKAWELAGEKRFPGHTELLAVKFGAKRVGMMFDSPSLRVMLATVHMPLFEVRHALTIGCVYDAIEMADEGCRSLGLEKPRIAVCGLNPHAGEGGLLGDEDERIIKAAIDVAVNEHGIDATGPHPADTVYNAAVDGRYDCVVAMYHDQGLIPVKLLHRDDAVNMTVGLPKPRTSPDHGTAFDIAGKNKAHAGSMAAALKLAVRLAGVSSTPA